jgi:Leucine-rich repeat (LRR) protein
MKKSLSFVIISVGLLLSGCSLLQSEQLVVTDNKLDLSNQNLQKISEDVFDLEGLEELDVSNNQLTGAIPSEIRQLQNLRILNASNNQMIGVPAEIGQLNNLEILDLSNNLLTGLPNELGNLQNLKTLNISGNDYSEADLITIQEKLPEDVEIIK